MFAGRWSSTSIGVIGIDFGSRSVKMLQARERAGKVDVVAAAQLDTVVPSTQSAATIGNDALAHPAATTALPAAPSVEGLAQQIRAAHLASGFRGPRCVVGLPREDVHLQSIRLPSMPDHELRQTALWEASQRFGLDRNAMEVDFIRTGATLAASTAENREEVILVAASHAAIHARLEPVLAAGLRPVAVEASFSALVRTFSRHARREADRAHVRAVVEVGESGTTVLILRGDQIAFCKPIAIGGRLFNAAVADHLQMTEQQAADLRAARIMTAAAAVTPEAAPSAHGGPRSSAQSEELAATTDPATDRAVYESVRPLIADLVKEVMLCLRYYGVTFRGHPPDHIIMTGGDGLEPRLAQTMASTCKTPVVFDDPAGTLTALLPGIRHSLGRSTGPAACWAASLGLSMRGWRQTSQRGEHRSVAA